MAEFGSRMQAVLDAAAADADRRGVPYIGTEHVLVAIAQAAETVGGQVLASLLPPDDLDQRVQIALGDRQREIVEPFLAPVLDRADQVVGSLVSAAQDEARALDDNHVGTEHVLLAALSVSHDLPLADLGVTRSAILEGLIDEPGFSPPGFIPWTPRALRAIAIAGEGAASTVAARDVILGLAGEAEEFAASGVAGPQHLSGALAKAGNSLQDLRSALAER